MEGVLTVSVERRSRRRSSSVEGLQGDGRRMSAFGAEKRREPKGKSGQTGGEWEENQQTFIPCPTAK